MKHLAAVMTTLAMAFAGARAPLAAPASASAPAAQEAAAPAEQTEQVKSLLLKIFLASARVRDLAGLASSSGWKMSEAERALLQQQIEAAESELQTLEKWRYQFLYHPSDSAAGGQTLAALTTLIPEIQRIAKTAAQYGGAAAASQFNQPLSELTGLRDGLHSALQERFPKQFPAVQAATAPSPAKEKPAAQVQSAAPVQANSAAATAPASEERAAPPQPAATPANVSSAASPAAAPTSTAPAVTPDQAKAALKGVFLTEARLNDLLGLLKPDQWKMHEAERELLNVRLQNAEAGLKTLEKSRYQFLYNIGKTDLGEQVVSSIGSVIPGIEGVGSSVAQYEDAASASGFQQAASQLAGYQKTLTGYLASLKAKYEAELAAPAAGAHAGAGLETEHIETPAVAPPPVRTLAVATPPLTGAQVKQILQKVYVSEYRVRDLLGQEQPARWKAPPAERQLALQARAELLERLSNLEKWRQQFSEHPAHMYEAFQTYLAINSIFHPLRVFGREAGKYESENMASAYERRAVDMEAQMNGLVPYIGFILQHADDGLDTYRSDLASCQNQLGYAMHQSLQRPVGMKNIVPVFQGRRARRNRAEKKEAPRQ